MTYRCKNCTYIFSRKERVSKCPYCGKSKIIIATDKDHKLLESILDGELL